MAASRVCVTTWGFLTPGCVILTNAGQYHWRQANENEEPVSLCFSWTRLGFHVAKYISVYMYICEHKVWVNRVLDDLISAPFCHKRLNLIIFQGHIQPWAVLWFYMSCSKSNGSQTVLWAHKMRGRCWWYGNRVWTFSQTFHYILLLCDRWQQRGSLTKWQWSAYRAIVWNCISPCRKKMVPTDIH